MVDRLLANDWVLRILSLLLAIGIWVSQNPTVDRQFTALPVTVLNTGSLRVATTPTTVSVELKGPAQILNYMQPSAIRVIVSSPAATPGRYQVPIHVSAPIGVVVAVQPAQATIVLTTQTTP